MCCLCSKNIRLQINIAILGNMLFTWSGQVMIIQAEECLCIHSACILGPEQRHICEAPVARRAREGARRHHTPRLTGDNVGEQGTCLDTNIDLPCSIGIKRK